MTTLHLISLISLAVMLTCSAMSKAIMDTCASSFESSVFKNLNPLFWNKAVSWRNKWKDVDRKIEAFPGSSTIFVSFTDAWHLFQHFFLLPLFLAPIAYSQCFPIIPWNLWMVTDFILMYVYFTSVFSLFYWIFNKK